MESIVTYFQKGGPAIAPLCLVAVFLYHAIARYYLGCFLSGSALAAGSWAPERLRDQLTELDRQLRFIRVMAYVLPLIGLLGTVMGMVKTFEALGQTGSGVAAQIGSSVSSGIAEALLSTQTGLAFAVPALVVQGMISRDRVRLRSLYRASILVPAD